MSAGRGSTPYILLDYFPSDFLFSSTSRMSPFPRCGCPAGTSQERKLIDYGFRLLRFRQPPACFEEFETKINQAIFARHAGRLRERKFCRRWSRLSARPACSTRKSKSDRSWTGRRPAGGSAPAPPSPRVLVTTLTKKMAEDLPNSSKKTAKSKIPSPRGRNHRAAGDYPI